LDHLALSALFSPQINQATLLRVASGKQLDHAQAASHRARVQVIEIDNPHSQAEKAIPRAEAAEAQGVI
jgi:hypothetical protein